jgi:hypothetical protein
MGKSTCGKNFQLYEMRVLVILFSIVNPSDGKSRKARWLQRFGARGNGGTALSMSNYNNYKSHLKQHNEKPSSLCQAVNAICPT